ncbi:hypothetical protein KL930_000677 [Ogataea haglerorum]|uniref:methionyl-tRNA formyltransferase n=1 Tax=Ogataea haglerorum TaxID=1937702 RepID=A0ABQ7RP77_9ASCO|nr:hypothetical protein KL915_000679 [Ogataea haglerorum]KAG7712233.1 hypothetical protein KL950_000104 [Ogataea haglerorum]KAG7722284.1 hypothetical protein KL913_000104 [Ogataea haglerorum]KAG7723613.1 hypothetical protein KL949_000663 [Ogataea haglerorum]KAG7734538.1 hypothetical protein KL948_000104 [Ogataea haglerorum]
MPKIAYFGSDKFSIRCLTHLLPKYADAVTVVARTAKLSGRGLRQYKEPLIVEYASQAGLPVVRADERADFDLLRGQFDICVAVSFGLLIPASFLESLKYPGLNVHPSLLPAFSGPAPMQRALLSHQKYTGVSLQTLDKKRFDRGRILAQERQEIAEAETLDSLCEKLADSGGKLLRNSLDTGLYEPQNYPSFVSQESYSYAAKIKPAEKHIDWNNYTTEHIMRRQNTLGPLFANVQAVSKENQPILKRVYLPNLQPATTRQDRQQNSSAA